MDGDGNDTGEPGADVVDMAMAEGQPVPTAIREAGAARFDPTPYLRQLRGRGGGGEYLDVKWRLLWLRTEHPDARIVTEHVQIEPSMAIFKATVTLPSGGVATGYGSETPGDFGDYIEKAETKAIGRALNALGYGAQFREPGDDEPVGAPAREPQRAAPPRPIDLEAQRERAQQPVRRLAPERPPRPEPVPAPTPAASDADAEAAFTWPAFREWANAIGLTSREQVNELLGRDTSDLGPAELRDAILAARGEG